MTAKNDLLDEAKKRLQLCISADDGDRADSLDDLRFGLGGEYQWDDGDVRQRELDSRPCLTTNTIPAMVHQVTNDVRQNRQSIQVHPVDDGADVETAEVIEGLIRHIEYDSGADAAYDTALDTGIKIGFGFFRLTTEYCNPLSFDLDMKIKRIRNPFSVYIDPAAQEADGSDMRFAFVTSKMGKDEFKLSYPNRDPSQDYLAAGTGDNANWIGEDYVRICEYYYVKETADTLVLLSDGKTILKSELGTNAMPFGIAATKERPTLVRKIMWAKLTALEVLEEAEIPFDWIPIFPVYGDEVDLDGNVTRFGLIRNAKDPAQMYNYWLTSATEEIALRTKAPYIGAVGQFEGMEDDWASANSRAFPYLEYNPVTVDGSLAPAPQRQPPADVPSGFIAMAGLARDNVKAVTGIYDASLGNRSNETSGIAIRARQHQGDVGNFHFSDNFTRAIRHLGRCIISGIPKVYDAPRVARILGADSQAEHVKINTPGTKQVKDPETGEMKAIHTIINDLTVGKYDCVVTTGPAYNTLRAEAADSMVQMAQSWPKLMEVAGDKVVRSMDWPGASDIADRIAKTLPPGIADGDDQQEAMVQTPKGPIPAQQAGQLIAQMDHTLEQMHAELEKLESGMAKAELDASTKIKIAEIQNAGSLDVAELKGMIDMLKAQMNPLLAHQSAVIAAADPEHPNAPAPVAQGMAMAPAEAEAMQGQPMPPEQPQGEPMPMGGEPMPEPQTDPDAGFAPAPEEGMPV